MTPNADYERGLYGKYKVERVDSKGITLGCFVLEFEDPKAWDALLTYAETCEAWGNLTLAADLRKRVLAIQRVAEYEASHNDSLGATGS